MAENSEEPRRSTRNSIYRAARSIKRRDSSLYNALRSIYRDSFFVREIFQLWPKLPLVANLRCGLWYSTSFDATCYFKSTDGHTNNLSFNTSRLNLHLALLAETVIWLNDVPDHDSWDFTPLILVSASASEEIQRRTNSEFSWNYIPGAGDDEESWARGLSPNVFWKHVNDLIDSGPDLCNEKVAEIVEIDRVYQAHRGQEAPQIVVKGSKSNSQSRQQ